MFSDACAGAATYTRHAIISWQTANGNCQGSIGAFLVVNEEGWLVSAGHLATTQYKCQQDVAKLVAYDAKPHARSTAPTKRTATRRKDADGEELVRRTAIYWGADGVIVPTLTVIPGADILLGKITNPDILAISEYPKFRRPASIRQGMSLVRLGYPFINVDCKYNEAADRFENGIPDTTLDVVPILVEVRRWSRA